MKRRCAVCRALIDTGSYCPAHSRRWKPDLDRRRGRWNMDRRSRVITAQAGRCTGCGRADVPLQVHHLDGDHRNDQPANTVALCPSCHRKAEHHR